MTPNRDPASSNVMVISRNSLWAVVTSPGDTAGELKVHDSLLWTCVSGATLTSAYSYENHSTNCQVFDDSKITFKSHLVKLFTSAERSTKLYSNVLRRRRRPNLGKLSQGAKTVTSSNFWFNSTEIIDNMEWGTAWSSDTCLAHTTTHIWVRS